MEPIFELGLHLPERGSRLLLRQLHAQLKAAILDGRLKAGVRLPATRTLAGALTVSRNTVLAAYERLLSEGYLTAQVGSGTFVSDVLPRKERRATTHRAPGKDRRLNAIASALELAASGDVVPEPRYDFRLGVPYEPAIEFDLWRRLSARALRAMSRRPVGYALPQGQLTLRDAIAGYVSFARAVACSAENVVVTAGAQQAFDLLARILVTPGRTAVAVEDPGYPPMRAAFAAAGAKIVPIRVDAEGMRVETIPAHVRVICVTPAHQFPLGSVLSARRRVALLDFARAHDAVIIEDDYDGEFRFGGRPLDALQTLDRSESVFFVGTFSKNLFPALRLGYVVTPPWALSPLVATKQRADWHCNLLAQDTLAAFIAEGHLARHIRKTRSLYAARRNLLLERLRSHFARWLDPVPGTTGLHLATVARRGVDVDGIIRRARSDGVGVYSLRDYGTGRSTPRGLLFGYGAIDEAAIGRGLERLLRVFATGRPTQPVIRR